MISLIIPLFYIACNSTNPPAPSPLKTNKILGDFAGEIRKKNGHIDTPTMIQKLKELNVNTYYYLVWHKQTDWQDLKKDFLPAAQEAGINVIIYLVPPSEFRPNQRSYPCLSDYVKWAKEIAQLSLQYSNLKGWAIDDFGTNLDKFTPAYLGQVREAEREINPDLIFEPVLYYRFITKSFIQKYNQYFDSIIFPYKGFKGVKMLPEQLNHIIELLDPFDKEVIPMVYAYKYSKQEYRPQADYVRNALQTGLNYTKQEKIAGVTTYNMKKEVRKESCKDEPFPYRLSLNIPWAATTKEGDYAKASQKVQLDSTADNYHINFRQKDSYKGSLSGYHFKQLLVNGHVVWDVDVSNDEAEEWKEESFDLTSYLQGKPSAIITFRLYEKKPVSNFGIVASFTKVRGQGFDLVNSDFSEKAGWNLDSSSKTHTSANYEHHICDSDRQLHVFDTVKKVYNSY